MGRILTEGPYPTEQSPYTSTAPGHGCPSTPTSGLGERQCTAGASSFMSRMGEDPGEELEIKNGTLAGGCEAFPVHAE